LSTKNHPVVRTIHNLRKGTEQLTLLGLVQKQLRTFHWENIGKNADLILNSYLDHLGLVQLREAVQYTQRGKDHDPVTAIYYDQMVNKGKHHVQAICCCGTHLLDRVRVMLRDGGPMSCATWMAPQSPGREREPSPPNVATPQRKCENATARGRGRRNETSKRRENERGEAAQIGKRLTTARHLNQG